MKLKHKLFINTLAICYTLPLLVFGQGLSFASVKGESMVPAYYPKDILILARPNNLNLQLGDTVTVRHDKSLLLKRLVGTEGDLVVIKDGHLYVNPDTSPYPVDDIYTEKGYYDNWRVNEGRVFLIGDNRGNSVDSRDNIVAQPRLQDITGKVLYKFGKNRGFSK